MAIKSIVKARLNYRTGWRYFSQQKMKEQQYILKWIRQIQSDGSEEVLGLVDDLDHMANCASFVKIRHQQNENLYVSATIHFATLDNTTDTVLLGVYLEDEDAEKASGDSQSTAIYAFAVIKPSQDRAILLAPSKEDEAWWPENYRQENGLPLSEDMVSRLIALAS